MNVKKLVVVGLVTLMVLLSFNLMVANAAAQAQMPMPGQLYTVRPGDTMYSIANRFYTTIWAIAQANGIVNPSRIYVGQVLFIPVGGPIPPAPPMPQPPFPIGGQLIHVVRYGENLYGIARLYGVSAWQIAYVNGLANPNYIYAGQQLLIPRPSPMPSPVYNPPVYNPWGGYYPYPNPMPYQGTPVLY